MSQVNRKDRPAVYCFTPMGGWTNQQLVKNCGALPYVFYKNYGFKAVMVGARVAEYTFLDTCIKGVEMDFLPDGTGESRLIYVAKHAKDMDLVVLHGFSSVYIPMVKLYKELYPDGKTSYEKSSVD